MVVKMSSRTIKASTSIRDSTFCSSFKCHCGFKSICDYWFNTMVEGLTWYWACIWCIFCNETGIDTSKVDPPLVIDVRTYEVEIY